MFKSLLFLRAGVVIHRSLKWQDIRFLGKNWARLPVSMGCVTVANLSLCGIPFLSGFYSKDLILEMGFQGGDRLVVYIILVTGTLFTSWYSLRLRFNLFLGINKRVSPVFYEKESSEVKLAYRRLFLRSVVVGFLLVNLVSELDLLALVRGVEKFIIMSLVAVAISVIELTSKLEETRFFLNGYQYLSSIWNFKPLLTQLGPYVGLRFAGVVAVNMEKG